MQMKNHSFIAISIITVASFFTACTDTNNKTEAQNISDSLAGTNSATVLNGLEEIKIGTQTWDATNLAVTHFRNSDPIPHAPTTEEWEKAGNLGKPAWCFYNNDSANDKKYGKLYNWYAVNDKRGLAPEGRHVSTDTEWTKLINYLGGEAVAGSKIKSTLGWNDKGNGSNTSGFTALPGGYRFKNGVFNAIGYFGSWWSSTESYTYSAWFQSLRYDDDGIYRNNYGKQDGFSVRCLKN
jgi:uncharacterized protein (TIGR02145 family)